MEKKIRRLGAKRIVKCFLLLLGCFLLLGLVMLAAVGVNMNEAALSFAEARIMELVTRVMNDSVLEIAKENAQLFDDMITAERMGENVYVMRSDPLTMNIIAASCTEKAQDRLSELGEQGIRIPIGTLTNIPFFAGAGPDVQVKFMPVGSIKSEFFSSLTASGINQTLYRVAIRLSCTINLIMPTINETIYASTDVIICESVIVGDVPQVYTDVANEEDMINLIPTELP